VDANEFLVVLVLAWGLLGLAAALLMGRRGHQPFMWLVLAVVLGPLVLPLAVSALRADRPGLLQRLSTGRPGSGAVDVLVGIDGSAAAEEALRTAIEIVGGRLGRLTLATVVDYDVAVGSGLAEARDRARTVLVLAAGITGRSPETVVLSGRPAESLRKRAVEEGYELLAIGRRGGGASHAVLGSVATELARGADVPVLIV
jgi:nucleotide-binding universal stress UspA family protein